jgi:hypothetical protein
MFLDLYNLACFFFSIICLLILLLQVKEGSPEWDALAERNTFDVRLYDYIQVLFNEQKEVIETLHNP